MATKKSWDEYIITRDKSRYEVISKLGEGSFGVVKLARDTKRSKGNKDDLIAMKRICRNGRRNFPEEAKREIELLGYITHPNIIGFKGVLVDGQDSVKEIEDNYDGNVYILLEYAEVTLSKIIKKLTDKNIYIYMVQLLSALEYLESYGILHRDIKASNILVTADNRIKICDFGLARVESQSDMSRGVGTIAYSAPEILRGSKSYSSGVDIWSLGCVFGEMLLGRKLFEGASCDGKQQKAIYNWMEKDASDLESDFSSRDRQALDLLLQMLNLRADKRISASQALDSDYISMNSHHLTTY